jgi:hypothetical protein
MHKWIASAAGGTSQRLNPGFAMVRSRDNKPGASGTGKVAVLAVMNPPVYLPVRLFVVGERLDPLRTKAE